MAARVLKIQFVSIGLLLATTPLTLADTIEWSGKGGTNRWIDAANWKGGKEPSKDDVARIGLIPPGGRIVLDQSRSVGRLEVEFQSNHERLLLGGHGRLLLTGVDTMPGKPVSLRVANGTLEIGPSLKVDVRGTRPQVITGGILVVSSSMVRGSRQDLKFAMSQTGVLRVAVPYWEPELSLDISTNRSKGLGPRVIDFGLPAIVAQGVTFTRLKEHDGDPVIIRGFERGDYLRFREDPTLSTDPGKEFVLSMVRFEGWAHDGRAEIRSRDGFWYLLPAGEPVPEKVATGRDPRPSLPRIQLDDVRKHTVFEATAQFPRNSGGDIVKLEDGRWLLAFSQWQGATHDNDASRVVGMISSDQGRTWGERFVIVSPQDDWKIVRMPNFLRLGDGTLALFVRCHGSESTKWVSMLTCPDESKLLSGQFAWTLPRRITPPPPGGHVLLSNRVIRLSSGRILIPLASPWPWDRQDTRTDNIRSWCLLSDDDGKTWRRSKSTLAGPARGLMEPCVVELKDRRLLMLMRTQTHRQYRSISEDGGDTWTRAAEVTRLVSPESPAAVRRDPRTGWLMVVWNHNSNLGRHARNRNPLTVGCSHDEGESWFGFTDIETDPGGAFSYPSISFLEGRANVTYYDSRLTTKGKRVSFKLCSFVVNASEPQPRK